MSTSFSPADAGAFLLLFAALAAAPPASFAPAQKQARVWQETVVIPTYQDGLPDPNPPFDLFLPIAGGRLNYPYTLRNNLTDVRTDKTWRALWLENEYLKCLVLPDLGGHLYGCTDKRNGREMFYANPSIKPARIAYRGAWAAVGVEFNFPVSHNWMTVSPVDFATTTEPDGSASVWVGNVDRPYGMQWRVQLTLRPGRAVLEQRTALYNRSDVRHRFYWWTNAGVEVRDDSRILYPMERTASHGFTFVDTWPIDSAGHDLSVVGNHKYGPVSRFSHGSREPFMGVFHPKTKSGVVHWSSPVDLPSKKLWSFGSDADGLDWRRALSDDGSAYVEIQAGPFRNQETYGFLEPQQSMRFSEFWLPMLDLGGLSRANPDALLNLSRENEKPGFVTLVVALDALRAIPNARLTVADGERTVLAETVSLTPAATLRRRIPGQLSAGTYTVRVVDAGGTEILRHTEGVYDYARDDVRTGPQPMPKVIPPAERTDGDFVAAGTEQELDGRLLEALATYREGLKRFPESVELSRAAGRLMVALKQYEGAAPLLAKALARVSNDREAAYYLGVAERALGHSRPATVALENAQQYGPQRAAALLELAAIAWRGGARNEALDRLERAVGEAPEAVRVGGLEVALLRTLGQADSARSRLKAWRAKDPASSFLRYEGTKLGVADDALWAHLAADPERILEIAVDYIRFGLFEDAIGLLGRTYPSGPAVVSEPGMPHPSAYPLVAYYRGWCRRQAGRDGLPDYRAASAMSTVYVFPHRPESVAVLKDAVAASPNDATAHFLLGSLYLSGGMTEAALKSWEEARTLSPGIPTLHRNMGYALLSNGATDKAIEIFREGTKHDRANVGVTTGLEQALTLAGRPAAERAEALLSFPDQKALPAPLVYRLALALAEAGRFDEAERQFRGRFFPREEGGTNVRQVWLEVRARRARALADPKESAGAIQDSDVPYGVGSWDAETLGNHRAVLQVASPAGAVRARIPWRRRDADPGKKNLVVESATAGRIRNVARVDVNREFGDIAFEAPSSGTYHVYYLPNVGAGRSNYPKVTYPAPEAIADERWLARWGLTPADEAARAWATLPAATVTGIEAIDAFNSFFPMEVIATRSETADLLARHPDAAFLAFAEDRTNPIRMTGDLPLRWIRRGAAAALRGEAERGEYYAFQVGVFAAWQAARDVRVSLSALDRKGGGSVPASAFNCINTGGVDSASRPFTHAVDVEKGDIQAIWCGVLVPETAIPGDYSGTISVTTEASGRAEIPFSLTVAPTVVAAHGDDEPWRLSRLRWLDSTLAVDDDLVKPYTPVTVAGNTVGILGRSVTLDALGFPEQIESRFAIEMTHLSEVGRPLLTGPIRLAVESRDPAVKPWSGSGATITRPGPGAAAWRARGDGGALTLDTDARMDFDGNIEFTVRVRAGKATSVEEIRLEIPMAGGVARYLMGLGFKGGARPASFDWKWDARNNQDSAWVGDVNAGLQFTLKDEKYVRPLNTNFYTLKPLVMPGSWHNGGKGGCRLAEQGASTYLVRCTSGARTLSEGETLFFNFRLLLTPFKTIDPKTQFTTRYFHAFKPVDDVLNTGANVVNVHHAGPVNPYINYPFFRPAEMKAYVDSAHARDMRVKIYYTVRELANRAPELFALRSLGEEIFAPGPGGGFSWLQEHLGGNYIAAWFVPELKDAAVVNSGVSRWHNFYVEGLDWLARHVGIDGLYIDDVAFDRLTMKRVRKVLDRRRPSALIDLHSANQYNVRDGFASSANLYLEHFPYLDRLWFGEYFDYGSAPDYWLTEISGIPFGLMGEMLQDNGNPWRGMVFGMTGRLPWAGDPRPIWKAWDDFGIAEARMVGTWVPSSPVKTGRTDVLATAYVRDGRTMVALASWAKERVDVRLQVDWKALGLDERRVRVSAPGIEGFQPSRTFDPAGAIPVEPGKGWLLLLERD